MASPDPVRQADFIRIRVELNRVFRPSAPINSKELFAGRYEQVGRVLGAVAQAGQHVVLFGERGVGKTSLASTLPEFWNDHALDPDQVVFAHIACETQDTFERIWARVSDEIHLQYEKRRLPFPVDSHSFNAAMVELSQLEASPDGVRRYFELNNRFFIVVIDEFDRVGDVGTQRRMADTIKTLSDRASSATLILVGVADTVDQLIGEHASIDRCLAQVLMPRMSLEELEEIIGRGFRTVGLEVTSFALGYMARLCQGFPHYAHLIGLHSGLSAMAAGSRCVGPEEVAYGLRAAGQNAQESIRGAYDRATYSPRPQARYREVLLACALARGDELGYFAPVDVRFPLQMVTEKPYDIQHFMRHLKEFCTGSRGRILEARGIPRRQRFRFVNPMMKPYVVIRGLEEGIITYQALKLVE